jgi:anti-sigma B factor antagonist
MTDTTTQHLHIQIYPQSLVASIPDTYLIDEMVMETVGKALYKLVEREGCRRLIIDFSEVRFLASAMLLPLFRLRDMLAKRKGALKLCGIGPDLMALFKLYPRHTFEIHQSVEEALASF